MEQYFASLPFESYAYGYLAVFLGMILDAPSVAILASFLAGLGYFNIYLIFFLSIAAEFVADALYYMIGYWGRALVIERYGKYVGLTKERVEGLESLLKQHSFKTLVALKLTPVVAAPGLLVVGATRLSIKKFAQVISLIAVPRAILFALIGYHFGAAYHTIVSYVRYGQYYLIVFVILLIIVFYLYKKFTRRISEKLIENGKAR